MGIVAFVAALMIWGCDNGSQEIDLVSNPEQREEAFNQILNNQELYYQFLDEVRENTTAMEWTSGNREYAGELFGSEHMSRMRDSNPGMDTMMMENMMNRMEQDTAFNREFRQRMQDRRLFHEDVMK